MRPMIFIGALAAASLLFTPMARAGGSEPGVLIRSPEVSMPDFEAALLARGLRPFSTEAEGFFVDRQATARLRETLARAQAEWLEGSLDAARAGFESVARLALASDWRDAQRESIHYAMTRLAQLVSSSEARDEWLRKAIVFAADLEPEPGLFPPPIYVAYKSERERLLREGIDFSPAESLATYSIVKLNGRVLKVGRVRLARGSYRVTALSDAQQPFHQSLEASELVRLHVPDRPLLRGDCSTPRLEGSVGPLKSWSALYSEGCLRSYRDGEWQDQSLLASENAAFRPTSLDPRSLWPSSAPKPRLDSGWPAGGSSEFPTSEPPRLTQRPWFWVGLAAAAIGVGLIVRAQQGSRSSDPGPPQPTHHEGF